MMIGDFLKRFWCKHEYKFLRNIYGDEINMRGGRSLFECTKCGDFQVKDTLE